MARPTKVARGRAGAQNRRRVFMSMRVVRVALGGNGEGPGRCQASCVGGSYSPGDRSARLRSCANLRVVVVVDDPLQVEGDLLAQGLILRGQVLARAVETLVHEQALRRGEDLLERQAGAHPVPKKALEWVRKAGRFRLSGVPPTGPAQPIQRPCSQLRPSCWDVWNPARKRVHQQAAP